MTELLRRCRVCGGMVGSCTDGVLFALGCMKCGRRTELVYRRSDAEREWQKMNEPEVVKRYPTWKEWQDMNFPNNDALMRPCIFESEEYFNCKQEIGCEKCMDNPIPADIAEKLGIKPIGGNDDGKM